ncbi:MAG: FlgD immunoglobulin-like domain containing protein, partial [bacterium]|nr:FlgD immunoglobulin-like domain containing protein [bacterium]
MKRLYVGVIFFVLMVCVGSSYAAILVTNQSATYSGTSTTISFRLNTRGFTTIYIKDSATNNIIKTIDASLLNTGLNNIIWDGTKDSGGSATTGDYYASVSAVGLIISDYLPIR